MSATVSATIEPAHEPWLLLPGFMPDALGFAFRATASLLLAYLVAFAIQLDTASSAGLCVAIVAQPTPGMAMSKAVYRAIGTVTGGVAAIILVAIFPQDRTMLLAGFTLWLGACTFVASLLRDFRSYGAVLCGYTVGIIAVAGIDAPAGAFLATLNRVAAILLGIASVAVVNLLTRPPVGLRRFGGRVAEAPGNGRRAGAVRPGGSHPADGAAAGADWRRDPGSAHPGGLRRSGGSEWPHPAGRGDGGDRRVAGHAIRHPRHRHPDAGADRSPDQGGGGAGLRPN